MVMGSGTAAHAEWHFGIGTGLAGQSYDGDLGLHIDAATIDDQKFEVDLAPGDVADLMETVFGLGGYATDGTWKIQYSVFFLKLEDDPTLTSQGGDSIAAKWEFEQTSGELTAAYAIFKDPSVIVHALGGIRYTGHKLEGTINADPTREIEEEWVDALIGLTVDVPLAPTWSWNNRVDAGFGGSEGTFSGSTGLTWAFAEHWAGQLFASFMAVEYENGKMGDTDWYLYDANEASAGIKILYRW
jgi:hypothetical protein